MANGDTGRENGGKGWARPVHPFAALVCFALGHFLLTGPLLGGCGSERADVVPAPRTSVTSFDDGSSARSSGPGFTKITHVTYDRLAVGEPVTFQIGLRANPGAYDVFYEVRDGMSGYAADDAPLSQRWPAPAGAVRIDKETDDDRTFDAPVIGPTTPGLYGVRVWVEPADGAIALPSPPVDIAVLADHPPVTDADVASWELHTSGGEAIESRQMLVESFAPVLLLAADERYHPQPVGTALDRGRVSVGGAIVDWDFGSARHLVRQFTRSEAAIEFRAMPEAGASDAVYYASVHRTNRGLAIGYWFFYAASDWREYEPTGNSHQGDWEGVAILFDGEEPWQWSAAPSRIALAQHDQYSPEVVERLRNESPDDSDSLSAFLAVDPDLLDGGEMALWSADAVQRVGDHRVLYVGLGSHATHFDPRPTVYICDAVERPTGDGTAVLPPGVAVSQLPKAPPDSIRCQVVQLPNFSILAADSPFAWMRFAGRWGREIDGSRGTFGDDSHSELICFLPPTLSIGNDGPRGPGFQWALFGDAAAAGLRWLDPHAWADQMNEYE
ncbi:MAG: hypothetical protein JSV19_11220 [Phycisphaerales bacterium]|nr:MAG: hypothetical protein JSV19_11220 [Phycisphaerales bacterium]